MPFKIGRNNGISMKSEPKMKYLMLVAVAAFATSAFAAKQTITCVEETKNKVKHEIEAKFDPSVTLNENWTKGKQGDEIITYKTGKADADGTTTARVTLTIPKGYSDAGDYAFAGYYEVNKPEKAGSGYSSIAFDGKAYRSIHGHDKNSFMDMMFYYPENVVGVDATNVPGYIAYQPSYVDQGYAQMKMICDSKVK
jgi:hypothetical protein